MKALSIFLVAIFFCGSLYCQNSIPSTGVDFYTDEVMFDAACEVRVSSVTEDFASSLALDDTTISCGDTIANNQPTNACYAMGDIVAGFNMVAIPSGIILDRVTDPSRELIGAVSATANTIINFTEPYNSVSLLAHVPFEENGSITYEVYGDSGLLGMTTQNVGQTPTFIGMLASEPISQVILIENNSANELISELTFGNCENAVAPSVPTLSQWGLIVLGLLFLIIGILSVKQKKVSFKAG